MKKIFFIFFFLSIRIWSIDPPFNRGINLTMWFQTSDVRQIHFAKFTEQDFINLKTMGVDVIRLPINLHYMTNGAPDYTIDPLFFNFLDQVVAWAENLEMHLILDNHTFDPSINTPPDIGDILIPVWEQMAEHYKNHSDIIYYEILNEPHGISDQLWNSIQLEVVEAIRAIDQTHTIIVGPAGWNGYDNLSAMPVYEDDNLIYTFHFYDPFIFTHQGANWTEPSLVPLAGVPFPYNSADMPPVPPELMGSWVEDAMNYYYHDGTVERIKSLIDIAVDFQNERNVKLFCGEFGVLMTNADNDDRIFWYETVRRYFESKGIAWTSWDFRGTFGLFEKGTDELFDYDLNIPLIEALGFNPPQQYELVITPDSTGVLIYDDYIGNNITSFNYLSESMLDYYNETETHEGEFCINWTDANQYNFVGFDFKPNKDLSFLVTENYEIDFWIKANTAFNGIDIRFVDTKIDSLNDHPWRMRYTIDNSVVNWNGQWEHVQIPLDEFTEHGSWDDGQWFDPIGEFDWTAIDRFEIVSEHQNLNGVSLWFDEIKIVDPHSVGVSASDQTPAAFELKQNYPNPFGKSSPTGNGFTTIEYTIPNSSRAEHCRLSIYDILGRKIKTLVNSVRNSGTHRVNFPAEDLPSGIYFYRLVAGNFSEAKKMIILK